MNEKRSDVVSASEIASWAWCPEAWRLQALGRAPDNGDELARGRASHARTAAVAVWSRRAAWLGWVFLAVAAVAAAVWVALAGGGE